MVSSGKMADKRKLINDKKNPKKRKYRGFLLDDTSLQA